MPTPVTQILDCLGHAVLKFFDETVCLQPDTFDTRSLWVDGLRTSYQTELRSEGPGPRRRTLQRQRRLLRRCHSRRRTGPAAGRDRWRCAIDDRPSPTRASHVAYPRHHRQVARAGANSEGVDHLRRRFRLHHLETGAPLGPTHRRPERVRRHPRCTCGDSSGVCIATGYFVDRGVARRASGSSSATRPATTRRSRRSSNVCHGPSSIAGCISRSRFGKASRRSSRRCITSTDRTPTHSLRRGRTSSSRSADGPRWRLCGSVSNPETGRASCCSAVRSAVRSISH